MLKNVDLIMDGIILIKVLLIVEINTVLTIRRTYVKCHDNS